MLQRRIVLVACFVQTTFASCHYVNGSDRNVFHAAQDGDPYVACDDTIPASMCCSRGNDKCVYLGAPGKYLCADNSGTVWRESCTDSSWKNPSCVKLFTNVTNRDLQVLNCSSVNLGKGFCYGARNYACCQSGQAVFIDPVSGEQVDNEPASTSITRSSTSSPSSSSTDRSATSTNTATSSDSSSKLSSGASAGIGVGVGLAFIIVIIGGVIFYRRSRRKSSDQNTTLVSEKAGSDIPKYQHPPAQELHGRSSHYDQRLVTEFYANQNTSPNELSGSSANYAELSSQSGYSSSQRHTN